jgi:ubiquinone/menaquinone biosynthesis C-methylase UbiE
MYKFEKIAKVYDVFSKGVPGDQKFYLEEAKKAKGKVLEIAVGTGRIFLELIKNNIDAYGFDISDAMISVLKEKAKAQKLDISDRILKQDMRSFKYKEKFDLIIIPYRAFLHNETIEDQMATLKSCYNHLNPGGRLILNFFYFNPIFVAERMKNKNERAIIKKKNYQLKIFTETIYEFKNQLINVQFSFEEKGKGRPVKKYKDNFILNWIGKREFEHLAQRSGFNVENLFGGFERKPFEKVTDEMVWVLEKK